MIALSTTTSNLTLAILGDPYHAGQHAALNPASGQAAHIEWLYWLLFWILAIVFVLVMATLTAAARKSVTPVQEILDISRENPGDEGAAWAVGTAVGVTVVTLLVVLVASVVTGKRVEAVPLNNSVTIQVRGHQWWWEITYPNSEPYLTVTTANEIHVPVGRPIVVLTDSGDVIHSLWAPNIAGKRDLLPGIPTSFSFQVDKPGIYHGQCAEFCGLQHAQMGFAIIAESLDQFSAWYRQQLKPAAEPANEAEARGRDVFLTHACVMCHTIRGTTAGSRYGPDLTHIASRDMIAAETLPNVPGALAGWILDPQGVKPGNHMAPNILAPDDLQALIAYLQSLH
ncbi:MAG TPA: cytochrome c oxidase subunit II [Candidatus Acidoferrales bacterium]